MARMYLASVKTNIICTNIKFFVTIRVKSHFNVFLYFTVAPSLHFA